MERKEVKIDFDRMINVEIKPDLTTKDIVKALNLDSPPSLYFYLGGSRLMAKRATLDDFSEVQIDIKPSTDFDYYATNSPQVVDYLISLGFKEKTIKRKEYMDDEAIAIYEINTNPKVQVVLRKDATFYQKVFQSISLKFYYDHLWKSAPHFASRLEREHSKIKDIMNQLFAIGRAFMPIEERGKIPEGPINRNHSR